MDEYILRQWTLAFVCVALLGVYLVILGIGLAGLVTAMKKRDAKAAMLRNREDCS